MTGARKNRQRGSEVSFASWMGRTMSKESGHPQRPWIYRQKKVFKASRCTQQGPSPTHHCHSVSRQSTGHPSHLPQTIGKVSESFHCLLQSPPPPPSSPPSEAAVPGLCLWLVLDPAFSFFNLATHCCCCCCLSKCDRTIMTNALITVILVDCVLLIE